MGADRPGEGRPGHDPQGFAAAIEQNATHGSDAPETAATRSPTSSAPSRSSHQLARKARGVLPGPRSGDKQRTPRRGWSESASASAGPSLLSVRARRQLPAIRSLVDPAAAVPGRAVDDPGAGAERLHAGGSAACASSGAGCRGGSSRYDRHPPAATASRVRSAGCWPPGFNGLFGSHGLALEPAHRAGTTSRSPIPTTSCFSTRAAASSCSRRAGPTSSSPRSSPSFPRSPRHGRPDRRDRGRPARRPPR